MGTEMYNKRLMKREVHYSNEVVRIALKVLDPGGWGDRLMVL